MQQMSFDEWFTTVQEIVLTDTGVRFYDKESVFMEYGRGDTPEAVADDIINEYNKD